MNVKILHKLSVLYFAVHKSPKLWRIASKWRQYKLAILLTYINRHYAVNKLQWCVDNSTFRLRKMYV